MLPSLHNLSIGVKPGKILTTEERVWGQKVYGPKWATEKEGLSKEKIQKRKAYVRDVLRGKTAPPDPSTVQPPADTMVETVTPPAAPPAAQPASPKRSTLHYDVMVSINSDQDALCYLSTPAVPENLHPDIWLDPIEINSYFSAGSARLFNAPGQAPHITLRASNDPEEVMEEGFESFGTRDGRVIWIQGAYSDYDGYAAQMKHVNMESSANGFKNGIEEMLTWLQSIDAMVWYVDDDNPGYFGRAVNRNALIIWNELYARMTPDQRARLLGCGYDEVHVLFGNNQVLTVQDYPEDPRNGDYVRRNYMGKWNYMGNEERSLVKIQQVFHLSRGPA